MVKVAIYTFLIESGGGIRLISFYFIFLNISVGPLVSRLRIITMINEN